VLVLPPKRDPALMRAAARGAEPCGAPQDRSIRAPQHAPPTHKLCQYTDHGFAPATQSRAAQRAQTDAAEHYVAVEALVVPAGQRDQLERVCRYVLRPPVASERLGLSSGGQVLVQFRRPWRDGTTHLSFDPVGFLGRLAALVPRPRITLLLYHGVLAPRAAWRSAVVPRPVSAHGVGCAHEKAAPAESQPAETSEAEGRRARGRLWAELMQRTFAIDVLACARCGGRLRLIALIEQAAVIQRILRHLGLPDAVPTPSPARAPPWLIGRHPHARYDPDSDDVEAPSSRRPTPHARGVPARHGPARPGGRDGLLHAATGGVSADQGRRVGPRLRWARGSDA